MLFYPNGMSFEEIT